MRVAVDAPERFPAISRTYALYEPSASPVSSTTCQKSKLPTVITFQRLPARPVISLAWVGDTEESTKYKYPASLATANVLSLLFFSKLEECSSGAHFAVSTNTATPEDAFEVFETASVAFAVIE